MAPLLPGNLSKEGNDVTAGSTKEGAETETVFGSWILR